MNDFFSRLKIFFRNLRRGGIYSVINIGGLAVGMAAAMLIFLWIHNEWSYDRFHTKEKQLYKVWNRLELDGTSHCFDLTPKPMQSALKEDYPEIAATARMMISQNLLYAEGDRKMNVSTGFTDPDFLTMFDFPLLQGNKETALSDPLSLILTERVALRFFGDTDPMGKTLLINNQYSVIVTGVMKDLPANTVFQFEALVPMPFMKTLGWYDENWGNNSLQTYVELQPNADLDRVNESVRDIVKKHSDIKEKIEAFLYPVSKQHLYGNFENGVPAGGRVDTLRIFGLVAVLILLVACINFTNLSTARSGKRAKEVGVRKVMGGNRPSLVGQFLGESIGIALMAGIAALVLVALALPAFGALMGKTLSFDWSNVWFWSAAGVFILLTGLLAGSYPAFYLSSFLPVKVLKGIFKDGRASTAPRKILVVVQFAVACFLIIATLVVHRQIQYAQDRETGYDGDQLIYHLLIGDLKKNYELIKQDMLQSGAATSVTRTSAPMTKAWSNTWGIEWRGKNPEEITSFNTYFTDADWTKTVGTTIVEGRDIDIYTYSTDSTAMLLNETAVDMMCFDDPVGEIVTTQGRDWHVVGVVKDFILSSPYEPIAPMFIGGPAGWFQVMHIRLNDAKKTADNLAEAEAVFKKYNPAYPFDYQFIDEDYARKFSEEQRTGTLASLFAGITIFISCLGLFALVAFMAETRKKEIGIRKVLGASVTNITALLSKEFLVLVLISVAIASPVAWWAGNMWLNGYAYHTDIPWWLFVAVGAIGLAVALLTVGWQAVKAATADPVKSIKTE